MVNVTKYDITVLYNF